MNGDVLVQKGRELTACVATQGSVQVASKLLLLTSQNPKAIILPGHLFKSVKTTAVLEKLVGICTEPANPHIVKRDQHKWLFLLLHV